MDSFQLNSEIQNLRSKLLEEYGLVLSGERKDDLYAALELTENQLKLDAKTVISRICSSNYGQKVFEIFLDNLKISETYFFREEPTLKKIIELVYENRSVNNFKIWSAGCSSGEEPYSLSILLRENFELDLVSRLRINATDINRNSLRKARMGNYTEWSFRNTTAKIKTKYFTYNNISYQIRNDIKNSINYFPHNLRISPYPDILHNSNIISCRNVLIYFDKTTRDLILNNFYESLCPGGFLFVGLTEIPFVKDLPLKKIFDTELIYFQKPNEEKETDDQSVYFNSDTEQIFLNTEELNEENEEEIDNFISKAEILFKKGLYESCVDFIITDIMNDNYYAKLPLKELRKITLLLIESLMNTGRQSEAIKYCAKYLSYNINDHYFYLMLANLYVDSKQYDYAIDNLTKAIYLKPKYIAANLLSGKLYLKLNNSKMAKTHLTNTLELLKNSSPEEIVEDTGGFSAQTLIEMVNNLLNKIEAE